MARRDYERAWVPQVQPWRFLVVFPLAVLVALVSPVLALYEGYRPAGRGNLARDVWEHFQMAVAPSERSDRDE